MLSGALVVCYHAISDTWDDPLATSSETMERQVRLLLRSYTAVSAEQVLANRPGTLHLTFDDAYRNVAGAIDALDRLRVPVTIFACSGLADGGRHFSVPELRDRLPDDDDELLTMGWEMLRELAERGVEIGSHTITHPHLTELGDDELVAELRDSRACIADRLGRPCRFVAYPYGDHDGRVRTAARVAGYDGAFTLDPPTGVCEPHAMPRVGIYRGDNMPRFIMKTARLRQPIMAGRARLLAATAAGARRAVRRDRRAGS